MSPAEADNDAVENQQKKIPVQVGALRAFYREVVRELGLTEGCVAVRLIDDKEMARLNETYRKKKGPTDVLSFPAEEQKRARGLREAVRRARGKFLGDIAIAPNVARRNAKGLERSLPLELRVLILHGVLHLLGYDHETDQGEMERVEMRLRRRLGIA